MNLDARYRFLDWSGSSVAKADSDGTHEDDASADVIRRIEG